MEGTMSTVGTAFYNDIVKTDSPAVKMFKDAGAIILVKSNVPQVNIRLKFEIVRFLYSFRQQTLG